MNRRKFIHTAGLGAIAYAALPKSAWSWDDIPSRNGSIITGRKLNVACIGVGGKGGHDASQLSSENIVALCDVDFNRGQSLIRSFSSSKTLQGFPPHADGDG